MKQQENLGINAILIINLCQNFMKSHLTAHMIVRNEEQWIWYAIMSVLDYVDRILIYDTGSTDATVKIIHSINSHKISYTQKSRVTPQELAQLRNEQIKSTTSDWFLLLDGDEVWPQQTMVELTEKILTLSRSKIGIVVKAHIPIGDLFHVQSELAGKYELLGKKGHYNMRVYRKTSNYHWECVPPFKSYVEKYVNARGLSVQNSPEKLILLDDDYWHMTHLYRTSVDTHGKQKYEIGEINKSPLPKVFFKTRSAMVPTPWVSFKQHEYYLATLYSPLVYFKRRLNL